MMTFGAEAVVVVWNVRASVDNGSSHAPPAPARRFDRCRRPSLQRHAHPHCTAATSATSATATTTAAAQLLRHRPGPRYRHCGTVGEIRGKSVAPQLCPLVL